MHSPQLRGMSVFKPAGITTTSIGKKLLMAITGIVFVLFVIGHMLGNLQIFLGQKVLNDYAETLKSLGPLLWIIRLFLITFFGLHLWYGIKLYIENRRSRPVSYTKNVNVKSTFSSRTMIISGGAMFLFVIYHILHYSLIVTNPEYAGLVDGEGRFDVYSMMILGFSNYYISAVYIIAMLFLSFHINHAVFSMFLTFGLTNERYITRLQRVGNLVAILVFLGYLLIPVGVLLNIVTLPEGGMR